MSKQMTNLQRMESLVEAMKKRSILVIGDVMLDEFIWGKVDRISPEAPVPVVQVTKVSLSPGGAANVARNLADFGVKVQICGVAGRDFHGQKLISLMSQARIKNRGLLLKKDLSTNVKSRIIARQQQVVRVDREESYRLLRKDIDQIEKFIKKIISTIDAIIIEDYGKGCITQEVVDRVVAIAKKNGKLVTADPNSTNPVNWSGLSLIKPNRNEAFAAAGMPVSENVQQLRLVGKILMHKWQVGMLLITLGEDGMMLLRKDASPYTSPTRAREVFDVSGAGDTAIAFFTAALSAGATAEEATEIANHAAGVVVGKIGTATLTSDELLASFQSHE